MINFNKKRFFRILSILTLGNFLLPIIFENIFFPFSSTLFYLFLWIISIIVFHPKILTFKSLFIIYFFFILFFFLSLTGVYKIGISWLRSELAPLFFAIIIYQYFIYSQDTKGLILVVRITFLFIITTLITSILGLREFPLAARDLGGRLMTEGEYELIELYKSMGIATYGFFYGLALAFPVFIGIIKSKAINNRIKQLLLIFVLLAFYGIIKGQFTAAALIAALGSLLAIISPRKIKWAFIIFSIILVIFIQYSPSFFANLVYYLSNILPGDILQSRLQDLSISLTEGIGKADTHIDSRVNRFPLLIESFISNPIFGGNYTTGHVFWLDRLSMFGIIGVIPWILILRNQIKYNLLILADSEKIYYLIAVFLFIILGFMKNMGGYQMMTFVFILIPGFLLVKNNLIPLKLTLGKQIKFYKRNNMKVLPND